MDYPKIINKLSEYKGGLEALKKLHHSEGNKEMQQIDNNICMIIRRIYPNPNEIENKLFPRGIYLGTNDDNYHQKNYLEKIEDLIQGINTIKEEFELMGFDDFTPIKEKVEKETKVGIPKFFSHSQKKTTQK